jgi:hypothetical protein
MLASRWANCGVRRAGRRASSNGKSRHDDDDDEQQRGAGELCTVTRRATEVWRWSATLCAIMMIRCGVRGVTSEVRTVVRLGNGAV